MYFLALLKPLLIKKKKHLFYTRSTRGLFEITLRREIKSQ